MGKRIIIADTNWWISLVIARFDNAFAILLENNELEFCSSEQLEKEIRDTFSKKKLQKYISEDIINTFWLSFHSRVSIIKIVSSVNICRDPKDNFLLSLAKDANADFLITGDNDLLVLGKFQNTIICTLTDFIDKYLKL